MVIHRKGDTIRTARELTAIPVTYRQIVASGRSKPAASAARDFASEGRRASALNRYGFIQNRLARQLMYPLEASSMASVAATLTREKCNAHSVVPLVA